MVNMKEAVKSFSKEVAVVFASCIIPTNEEGYWPITVDFINSDGNEDETQFDILPYRFDYGKGECRELESLWKEFCRENGFRQNSITKLHFGEIC